MKSPSLWKTIGIEIFSFSSIVWILFLALFYLFAINILLNNKLLAASITNHFPLSAIFSLVVSLFLGSFTSMSAEPLTLFIFLLNTLLVGLNIFLLGNAILWLRNQKKVHLSLGGATLFSLVTAGCASCGLSLLSVLGLSATLAFLPFHGAELRIIATVLLFVSSFYMLKKLHQAKYCRI